MQRPCRRKHWHPTRLRPALLRLERGIQFCEEAAQLVLLVEREFDLIEKSITA